MQLTPLSSAACGAGDQGGWAEGRCAPPAVPWPLGLGTETEAAVCTGPSGRPAPSTAPPALFSHLGLLKAIFSLLASRSEWGVFPPSRGYEIAGRGRGRPAGEGSHPLPLHVLWGVWGPAAPIPRASDGGGVPPRPPWGQAASRAIPGLLSGTWSEGRALVPVRPLQGQTPGGG